MGGPCFVLGGVFLALLLGSSSLRSRWVGGHRALYVVPTAAAAHVAVCKPWANYSSTRGTTVKVAKENVLKIARADLWWIQNRSDWLRDGGATVTNRVNTKAAWTAKWKWLARLAPAETDGLAATRGGALE